MGKEVCYKYSDQTELFQEVFVSFEAWKEGHEGSVEESDLLRKEIPRKGNDGKFRRRGRDEGDEAENEMLVII